MYFDTREAKFLGQISLDATVVSLLKGFEKGRHGAGPNATQFQQPSHFGPHLIGSKVEIKHLLEILPTTFQSDTGEDVVDDNFVVGTSDEKKNETG